MRFRARTIAAAAPRSLSQAPPHPSLVLASACSAVAFVKQQTDLCFNPSSPARPPPSFTPLIGSSSCQVRAADCEPTQHVSVVPVGAALQGGQTPRPPPASEGPHPGALPCLTASVQPRSRWVECSHRPRLRAAAAKRGNRGPTCDERINCIAKQQHPMLWCTKQTQMCIKNLGSEGASNQPGRRVRGAAPRAPARPHQWQRDRATRDARQPRLAKRLWPSRCAPPPRGASPRRPRPAGPGGGSGAPADTWRLERELSLVGR
jgi:hypothetical protein